MTLWLAIACAAMSACGAPPCREVSGAPSCEQTARALDVADGVLTGHGFASVASLAEVEWVAAESLTSDDVPEGFIRLGHSEPDLTRHGLACKLTIATRLQTSIAGTSLAHEMLHCSWALGCVEGDMCEPDGDHNHSRDEWSTVLPAMNDALRAEGI